MDDGGGNGGRAMIPGLITLFAVVFGAWAAVVWNATQVVTDAVSKMESRQIAELARQDAQIRELQILMTKHDSLLSSGVLPRADERLRELERWRDREGKR